MQMQWNLGLPVLACVVAADIFNPLSAEAAEAENLPRPVFSAEINASLPAVDDVDPAINKALPLARSGTAGGNLVIMRNAGEMAVSVSFDGSGAVKQLIEPGGSAVWSCQSGNPLPAMSLEGNPSDEFRRTVGVACGDVLVVGGRDVPLSKYEEQGPSKQGDDQPFRKSAEEMTGAGVAKLRLEPRPPSFSPRLESKAKEGGLK